MNGTNVAKRRTQEPVQNRLFVCFSGVAFPLQSAGRLTSINGSYVADQLPQARVDFANGF